MDGRPSSHRWVRVLTGFVGFALVVAAQGQVADAGGCFRRGAGEYGSRRCKVERLRNRSFVVIALAADSGINPYHHDFRVPADDDMVGIHPSEFIKGFPGDAETLELSLGASSYRDAVRRDNELWNTVKLRKVYTFPGTKILGGIAFGSDSGKILDEGSGGHGTATASVAAGRIHGSNPDVEALVVMIQGLDHDSLVWAFKQPWIDVVSGSIKCNYYPACGNHEFREATKAFVQRGGIAVFGSGNGVGGLAIPCLADAATASPSSGPPWHLVVGAASSRSGQPSCWHSIPPDVISYGDYWPAATEDSLRGEWGFSGTSSATPVVAGVVSAVILAARRAMGDAREGPRHGIAARGPGSAGLLRDGMLTGREAEEVVLKTARVVPFEKIHLFYHPWIWPNTPASFVYAGYGLVDERSLRDALDVLAGRAPMPDRSDVDAWMAYRDSFAGPLWEAAP